jgi:hypothetical protein
MAYPVDTIRLSRTRIAPTHRFMQFDLNDAREARRCASRQTLLNRLRWAGKYHKVGIPRRPEAILIQDVEAIQKRVQLIERAEVIDHM